MEIAKNKILRMSVRIVAVAMLFFGALFAADYQLDYSLITEGATSNTGTQTLCLPYDLPTGLVNASDLMDELNSAAGGGDNVDSISKFLIEYDTLKTYTGDSEDDFALVPGEGYRVQVSSTFDYRITGDHDDGLDIELLAEGAGSDSGTNDYCPPFNSAAQTASDLRDEINAATSGSVVSISRFLIASDLLQVYTGGSVATDFDLVSGESYRVQVSSNATFNPVLVQDNPVVDTADYLAVTVFPGRPGCDTGSGRIQVENTSGKIDFRVDWEGKIENAPPGKLECDAGAGDSNPEKDACIPATGEQCIFGQGGPICTFCNACYLVVDSQINHGATSHQNRLLPHCLPSCDNRFCDGGSNDGLHCWCDSGCAQPCPGGECTTGTCPSCGYHCTRAQDECVGGLNDGQRCDTDLGPTECVDVNENGECKEAGSVKAVLAAFRSVGEFAWTESVCSGGTKSGYACASTADCPTDGTCVDMAVDWTGEVQQSSLTWAAVECPGDCP